MKDVEFIKKLQRVFCEEVGFIPTSKIIDSLEKNKVLTGDLNSQEAGFLLFEPFLFCQPTTAIIVQAAVNMEAQRQLVGLTLVENLCEKLKADGREIIQASCLENLEANDFWRAAGFTAVARRPGGKKRKKDVIIWRKQLCVFGNLTNLPISRKPRGPSGKFVTPENAASYTLIK